MKTVVITGIFGQVGSYAADLYLEKGYRVVGLYRRTSSPNYEHVLHNMNNPNFILFEGDISDSSTIIECLNKYKPYAFLNFAAQSHVGTSFHQPVVTTQLNYLAVLEMLEAIRLHSPQTKFWSAATSERYGLCGDIKQDESCPPDPASPYSVAKLAMEQIIKVYSKSYGLYATYSIMFNMESPRRGKAFVTRKITDYIAGTTKKLIEMDIIPYKVGFVNAIKGGSIEPLKLGNIDARRSWTHASDTVRGIYDQIELPKPEVFCFGLEETRSIREFLTYSFSLVGVDDWSDIVVHDENMMRPNDVWHLKPTCTKAKTLLNWTPKYTFENLVQEMLEKDFERYGLDYSKVCQEVVV